MKIGIVDTSKMLAPARNFVNIVIVMSKQAQSQETLRNRCFILTKKRLLRHFLLRFTRSSFLAMTHLPSSLLHKLYNFTQQ